MVRIAVSVSAVPSPVFYIGGIEHLLNHTPLQTQRFAAEVAFSRHFKKLLDRIRAAPMLKGTKLVYIEIVCKAWDAFEAREVRAQRGIIIHTTLAEIAGPTGCGDQTIAGALKDLQAKGLLPHVEIKRGPGNGVTIEIGDVLALVSEIEVLLSTENL
jgi:hypothetical protein